MNPVIRRAAPPPIALLDETAADSSQDCYGLERDRRNIVCSDAGENTADQSNKVCGGEAEALSMVIQISAAKVALAHHPLWNFGAEISAPGYYGRTQPPDRADKWHVWLYHTLGKPDVSNG